MRGGGLCVECAGARGSGLRSLGGAGGDLASTVGLTKSNRGRSCEQYAEGMWIMKHGTDSNVPCTWYGLKRDGKWGHHAAMGTTGE